MAIRLTINTKIPRKCHLPFGLLLPLEQRRLTVKTNICALVIYWYCCFSLWLFPCSFLYILHFLSYCLQWRAFHRVSVNVFNTASSLCCTWTCFLSNRFKDLARKFSLLRRSKTVQKRRTLRLSSPMKTNFIRMMTSPKSTLSLRQQVIRRATHIS